MQILSTPGWEDYELLDTGEAEELFHGFLFTL